MRRLYSKEQIKQLAGGLYLHRVHSYSGLIIASIITTSSEKFELVEDFAHKTVLKYQGFLLPFNDENYAWVYTPDTPKPVEYKNVVGGSTVELDGLKGCNALAIKNAEGDREVIDFGDYTSIGKEEVIRL